MLVEVALMPHVFDNDSNPDTEMWLGCLNKIGHGFFPRNAASPVIATNLQDGGWIGEVKNIVGRIVDQPTRWRVQDLASRFKDITVARPVVNYWPTDEEGWADEAVASHRTEPIGRIVLTDRLHEGYQRSGVSCHPLKNVQDDAFWLDIRNTAQVPMHIGQQAKLLRPICVHAQYLALKLPHVRGQCDDATPFAVAVLESAFCRPGAFPTVQAELHVNGDGLSPDGLESVVHNIKHSLAARLPAGSEVLLCVWPDFIDRKLVAGVLTESAGQQLRALRWGVGFQHVARPCDTRPPTGWWLISQHDLAAVSAEVDADHPSILHKQKLQF